MKKTVLALLVIALSASCLFAFAGCSGTVVVPGTAWGENETLTYGIYDGETKIGSMVSKIETLPVGDHKLALVREEPFKITANVAMGIRLIMEAKDLSGAQIMYSESILNGFSSLASYKKINYNGNNKEVKGFYDGKKYHYSVNGAPFQKMTAKAGYMDNELIYTIIRCYDIDAAYNTTFSVIDAQNGAKESISIAKMADEKEFEINYHNLADEPKTDKVKAIKMRFSKATEPVGAPIYAYYAPASFKIYSSEAKPLPSYHIPIQIEENNLVYKLELALAK